MNRIARHIFRMLTCLLLLGSAACESMPLRAIRGAHDYAEGSEALERGDSQRAIVVLSRAAELVPQASEIQNHLGLAYWAAGQPVQARFAFERALAIDCDNQAARGNRDRLVAESTRATTDAKPAGRPGAIRFGLDDSEAQDSEAQGRMRHGG